PVQPPLGRADFVLPARPTSTLAEPCTVALEPRRARCSQLPWRQPVRACVGVLPLRARSTSLASGRAAARGEVFRAPAGRAACAARPHERLPLPSPARVVGIGPRRD